jgi:NAD(P)-dependent dehydrogenase (short-subunit alcohol dehydrogenase family)
MPVPVLISGGTGGIGQAIAQLFARSTAPRFTVHMLGRDAARASAAVLALPPAAAAAPAAGAPATPHSHSHSHSYAVGDVTRAAFWRDLAARRVRFVAPARGRAGDARSHDAGDGHDGHGGVVVEAPRPAVLINAAGVVREGVFVRADEGDVREVLEVNLLATMWACRYMFRALRSHAVEGAEVTPSIINVSSVLAKQGGEGVAAYAAAKAGVLGEMRLAIALDMG